MPFEYPHRFLVNLDYPNPVFSSSRVLLKKFTSTIFFCCLANFFSFFFSVFIISFSNSNSNSNSISFSISISISISFSISISISFSNFLGPSFSIGFSLFLIISVTDFLILVVYFVNFFCNFNACTS